MAMYYTYVCITSEIFRNEVYDTAAKQRTNKNGGVDRHSSCCYRSLSPPPPPGIHLTAPPTAGTFLVAEPLVT